MTRYLALAVTMVLGGCGVLGGLPRPLPAAGIAGHTAEAVDHLVETAPGLAPDTTILVASVADAEDLSRPSPLGRVITEEIGTRLIALGFRVPEVRLTDTLHVRQGGAFLLSSSVSEIRRVHSAEVAVTGTLAEFAGNDYINLRLIRLADGVAISAATFTVPGPAAAQLARSGR